MAPALGSTGRQRETFGFFETKQSELPSLRVASILCDKQTLEAARREPVDFVSHPPAEEEPGRAVAYIRSHWQWRYGLATVGRCG